MKHLITHYRLTNGKQTKWHEVATPYTVPDIDKHRAKMREQYPDIEIDFIWKEVRPMKQKRINRLILEFGLTQDQAERIYDICHHYEPDAAQPSKIIDIVMQAYGLNYSEFKTKKSRKHKDYFPRVCLSFFLRKYSKASLHQIARYTGRTHASILNHFKQIESLQYYPDFKEKFINIEKIIIKRLA
jgi:hypothetical protein